MGSMEIQNLEGTDSVSWPKKVLERLKKIKKIYLISIAVVIVLGGGYLIYHHYHSGNKTSYVTEKVEKGTITSSVSGSGNVFADESAKIDPTITGTVTDLSVKVGDEVKKGQLLFNIKNDQLQVSADKAYASYLQSKQSLESAKAQVLQAQADLDNANQKNSDKPGTVSDSDLAVLAQKITVNQAAVDTAQKNISVAYADYLNQKATAAQRKVTSPIDGTITLINIGNGDSLGKSSSTSQSNSTSSTTSQTPMTIDNLASLKASVQINEVDIPKIATGQKTTLTFDAIEGLSLTGKVDRMDKTGTSSQNVVTYNVVISFDSLDSKIKPGMSVTAAITNDVKQDVIIVPNSAVKKNTSGQSTVQIMKNGTLQTQIVEVGISNDTETEITNGLSVGDEIVTQTVNSKTSTQNNSGSSGGVRIPGVSGGGGFGR